MISLNPSRGGGGLNNAPSAFFNILYFKNILTGFTLAEVLITLGIIGIVAAMTLPALITRNQNKAIEAALKKNYSVILQAFEMYQAEHGERLNAGMVATGGYPSTGLKAQIMPYFKIIADCGTYSNTHPACIPYNNDNPKNPYSTYDGKQKIGLSLFDDGQFVLTDGSLILIENMNGSTNVYITVDVNGRNKRPNRWGHDLFTFQLTDDGRIIPAGTPQSTYSVKSTYCSPTPAHARNGIGCTYYALNDKDYFNNLPR